MGKIIFRNRSQGAPYFLEAKASIIRSYEYHKNNAIDTIFFMGDDAATIDWISSE